jgi:hypothetical protein
MRANLVAMLDHIGLNHLIGVTTCAENGAPVHTTGRLSSVKSSRWSHRGTRGGACAPTLMEGLSAQDVGEQGHPLHCEVACGRAQSRSRRTPLHEAQADDV